MKVNIFHQNITGSDADNFTINVVKKLRVNRREKYCPPQNLS
jgi:hypothetical protein